MSYTMKPKLGDYVEVVRVPDPWEGSGETEEDRKAYLGHIGRVGEVQAEIDGTTMLHVVFTDELQYSPYLSAGRNIEAESLRVVGRPMQRLPESLWEG